MVVAIIALSAASNMLTDEKKKISELILRLCYSRVTRLKLIDQIMKFDCFKQIQFQLNHVLGSLMLTDAHQSNRPYFEPSFRNTCEMYWKINRYEGKELSAMHTVPPM